MVSCAFIALWVDAVQSEGLVRGTFSMMAFGEGG
jgi:hypothetical protein